MKTYLHLCAPGSNEPCFNDIIDRDTEFEIGEYFFYSELYYTMLDPNAKKDFDRLGLKTGKYIVLGSEINEYAQKGKIRHVFLKPFES